MSNKILQAILVLSCLLSLSIFFLFRGFGWPLGREGVEALVTFLVFVISSFSYGFYLRKFRKKNLLQSRGVSLGLFLGLLWLIEISMNNLLRPGLPARDHYDDIFWAMIAVFIFISSAIYAFKIKKVAVGILIGVWSGFASGAVAGVTALLFIVFGMSQILLDPLNIAEWAERGATSNTPNMTVYFAYQTLAGAVLHLIVLGLGMGLLLGIIGGIVGKSSKMLFSKK